MTRIATLSFVSLVAFILEVRELRRILPTSEYIHSKDIFRVFLKATDAECKQRGPRAESMRLRAGITRFRLYDPAILIPACASSSPAFLMMYSAYKLNKQGDNTQP